MADISRNSKRGLILSIAAVVVVVALIFWGRSFFRDKVEVRTAKVSHADLTSSVSTNGKVEPVEDYQAHAAAPGVVQRVYVQVGQHVQRGAELIRMDDTDARSRVAGAEAALKGAYATLDNMQHGGNQDERLSQSADLSAALTQQKNAAATLASTQALEAKGSASANEVASAQQRLNDANARVSQLQTRQRERFGPVDYRVQEAQIAQSKAGLMAARAALANVDFRAPFAGTVYSVPIANYDFVQGGEAMLNMADLNRIQVRAYFDEPEIGKLHDGQAVRIVWDAKPNSAWHGHIARAPTTIITYGTRNVGECIITVDDAHGDLLPNTNVTVTVTVSNQVNVLSLPREALRTEGNTNFVYRVIGDHLAKTPVQIGALNNTRVEIVSGLRDGETVALSSPSNTEFTDQLEVKVLP